MANIIEVFGLSKHFNQLKAVDDLSFSVQTGDVYGFLGQNGAGKSTTLRMLLTLVAPTGGRMELFGMELLTHRKEILRAVGAVIERSDLYPYLSAYENLSLFARMSGLRPERRKLMDQLEQVGLALRAHDKVKTYSQGMKQRLGIAVSLVHNPSLLILDEPTNGLDPQGIADIRHLIVDLSRHHHKTILISSHLLSEIELIANRVLVIDRGRKVGEGRVNDLFDPDKMILEMQVLDPATAKQVIEDSVWQPFLRSVQDARFVFQLPRNQIPEMNRDLAGKGVQVLLLEHRHSLEDYFLTLTSPNQHVATFAN
jgi:ABC-type multidrug transport system ATPase subunit